MTHLELILKLLYNPKIDLIVCGDINIIYLENSNKVKQLNALLQTHNLIHTVSFPTRISKSSSTAIDNIFLDTSKYENYLISPIYNGLSDHDAQLLTIVLSLHPDKKHKFIYHRKINNLTTADFQWQLSHENWDSVIGVNDVNLSFNSFLNIYHNF
jgi:hypothetical protein